MVTSKWRNNFIKSLATVRFIADVTHALMVEADLDGGVVWGGSGGLTE